MILVPSTMRCSSSWDTSPSYTPCTVSYLQNKTKTKKNSFFCPVCVLSRETLFWGPSIPFFLFSTQNKREKKQEQGEKKPTYIYIFSFWPRTAIFGNTKKAFFDPNNCEKLPMHFSRGQWRNDGSSRCNRVLVYRGYDDSSVGSLLFSCSIKESHQDVTRVLSPRGSCDNVS